MLAKIYFAARWFRWRRHQMTNRGLRAYFRKHHAIDVGLYSYGCFDRWRMPGPMTIGRYCSFGNSVRVVEANHPIDAITTHPLCYDPALGVVTRDRVTAQTLVIEDDVWVGHNVVILPGCKFIGRGAIIGAGSIVTKDVPRYAIVVGNPAHIIRQRFTPAVADAIDASRWWDLDIAALASAERTDAIVTRPGIDALTRMRHPTPIS